MKNYPALSLFLGAAIFLCAACGTAAPPIDVSAPGGSVPRLAADASGAADASALEDGSYAVNRTITVDGGRTLTLLLHGKKQPDNAYGISSIDVLDGETTLQTISVHDAIMKEWGADDSGGCAESSAEDGGFTATDMNFDGSGDIGLQGWNTAGSNVPYYYWLWDSDTEQFRYGFCLCNAEPDPDTKQIVCGTRDGAREYDIDYYQYDETGTLQNVRRVVQTVQDDGTTREEVLTGDLLKDAG